MDYETFKARWNEFKPKIVLAVCFALVFLVGFGTGKYEKNRSSELRLRQANYTTKATTKPAGDKQNAAPAQPPAGVQVLGAASSTAASGSCAVKGNVGSGGKKIYHVQGGAFYKTVKPERCFATEAEARAAGFVKSAR